MTAYYFTIASVFVLSCMATQINRRKQVVNIQTNQKFVVNFLLFLIGAILVCVAGLRYYVGTDYKVYYNAFEIYAPILKTSLKELDEPGLPLLATIINIFTDDGIWIIFACSVITIGLIVFTTYQNVDTFVFSTMLIIFTGIWHGSFNGVRQYIAAAIVFWGYRYIIDKKFWKYAMVVFIAFLFHSSALFMIIPYFILKNKISFWNVLFLIVGTLIFLSNYDAVFSFVGFMQESEFDITNAYTIHQVNRWRVLAETMPALFCLFLYNKSEKSIETTFNINVLILNAVVSIATMNSALLTRFNIYTGMFLPVALGKLIVQKEKKAELIWKFIIIILYFAFWYYEISKSSDLSNFEFVF